MNGDTMMDGGCNGRSLGTSQLQRRLYVLLKEGCLDGHLVRQVAVNNARDTLEDMP